MITDKTQIAQWIEANRFTCSQYGAWMIGCEPNTQDPGLFANAELRVLIFRLSQYHYVAASMAHGLLGQITASIPGVYADYGFMPPPEEAGLMQRDGIPPLFGTSSRQPAAAFDILAISNALGQELVNLAFLLSASGFPMQLDARLEQEALPLIIMGGANALSAFITCQPAGASGSCLVDALYLGEAEVCWEEIVLYVRTARQQRKQKAEILMELADRFPAVYTPVAREQGKTRRVFSRHLPGISSLTKNPLWYNKETLGYSNITIDRGCPFLCYFCKDAWERRPYRERPVNDIIADLEAAKKYQGLDTINFFSSNFSSYRNGAVLIREAVRRIGFVAVKSQRFDTLLSNNRALQMQWIGKSSYTFGLEGVSQRIRNFLNKNITASQVLEAAELIFAFPLRQVKIFLIITGHETDNDLAELERLLRQVRNIEQNTGAKNRVAVILSLTPFIPMPHTPFQFHPFPDAQAVKWIVKGIKKLGALHNILVRESISVEEAQVVHWLNFASGDQLTNLAAAALRYRYYKELNPAILELFRQHTDPAFARWLANGKGADDKFPWDRVFIRYRQEKELLYKLYRKAMLALQSGESPALQEVKPGPGHVAQEKAARIESSCLWFRIDISRERAGVLHEFFQVSMARELCLLDDNICRLYLRRDSLFEPGSSLAFYGQAVFSLRFLTSRGEEMLQLLEEHRRTWKNPMGWELQAFQAAVYNPHPGGITLVFNNLPVFAEKDLWLFTDILKRNAIKHQVRNSGALKLLIAENSSQAQFHYLAVDREQNSLYAGLKVPGTAANDSKQYLGFLKKTPFEYLLHTPARILNFWNKDRERKCPVCKKNLLVDAFSGQVLTGTPCDFFCKQPAPQ